MKPPEQTVDEPLLPKMPIRLTSAPYLRLKA